MYYFKNEFMFKRQKNKRMDVVKQAKKLNEKYAKENLIMRKNE